jgi:hypothetical protein
MWLKILLSTAPYIGMVLCHQPNLQHRPFIRKVLTIWNILMLGVCIWGAWLMSPLLWDWRWPHLTVFNHHTWTIPAARAFMTMSHFQLVETSLLILQGKHIDMSHALWRIGSFAYSVYAFNANIYAAYYFGALGFVGHTFIYLYRLSKSQRYHSHLQYLLDMMCGLALVYMIYNESYFPSHLFMITLICLTHIVSYRVSRFMVNSLINCDL